MRRAKYWPRKQGVAGTPKYIVHANPPAQSLKANLGRFHSILRTKLGMQGWFKAPFPGGQWLKSTVRWRSRRSLLDCKHMQAQHLASCVVAMGPEAMKKTTKMIQSSCSWENMKETSRASFGLGLNIYLRWIKFKALSYHCQWKISDRPVVRTAFALQDLLFQWLFVVAYMFRITQKCRRLGIYLYICILSRTLLQICNESYDSWRFIQL